MAAIVTWVSYAVCALLISYTCAVRFDMGLVGIWIGPTFAVAFNFFIYLVIWAKMDWSELIDEAK